jgi:hypothetical protein
MYNVLYEINGSVAVVAFLAIFMHTTSNFVLTEVKMNYVI